MTITGSSAGRRLIEMPIADTVIAISVFVAAPLFYSETAMDPALYPRRTFIMLIIGAVLLFNWKKSAASISDFAEIPFFRPLIIISALILGFSLLSVFPATAFSEYFADFLWIGSSWVFVVFFLLWFKALDAPELVFSRFASIGSFCLCFVAVFQYFGIAFTSLPGNYVVYATMANKNLLANALALVIPLMIYGGLRGQTIDRNISMVSLPIALFIVVVCATRSAWLAAGVSLAIYPGAYLLLGNGKHPKRKHLPEAANRLRILIVVAGLGLVSGVISHNTYTRQDAERSKALAGTTIKISSIEERMALWSKSAEMIAEHPIFGVGGGHWKLQIPKYGAFGLRSAGGSVNFIRPHNDSLWIVAERGLPTAICYIILFFLLGMLIRRGLTKDKLQHKEIIMLCLAGIAAYAVAANFSFPRERVYPGLILAAYTALLLQMFFRQKVVRGRATGIAHSVLLCTVLFSILAAGVFALRWHSENLTRRLIRATELKQWRESLQLAKSAENRFYEIDPSAMPLAAYAGQAYVQIRKFDQADKAFYRADKLHPHHLLTLGNLAAAYHRKGNLEKAIEYSQRALRISPQFDKIIVNLAIIYMQQKKYQKAWEVLQNCDPYSVDPRVEPLKKKVNQLLKASEAGPKVSEKPGF